MALVVVDRSLTRSIEIPDFKGPEPHLETFAALVKLSRQYDRLALDSTVARSLRLNGMILASMTNAPIVVSALFGAEYFAWLDELRRSLFPPERNQLDAHLTLFYHLPPWSEGELKRRLAELARGSAPSAVANILLNLGRGVAIRIASPDLEIMRGDLAHAFSRLLTPQDANGWRPHVTIQNKVLPAKARALLDRLQHEFQPRPVRIAGLAARWYRGGPWELLFRHQFR